MTKKKSNHYSKFTNVKFKFSDKEKAVYEKQQKTIDTIYKYADSIYEMNDDKEFVKDYYRCLLHAIYDRTGKTERHGFVGIVTNIVSRKKNLHLYLMNVYWYNVYVSHHIVIKIPYDDVTDEIDVMDIGDFLKFTALIEEYEDGDDFGLTGFELIRNSKINNCVTALKNSITDLRIENLDIGLAVENIDSYSVKSRLYHYLRERISSYNRMHNIVPYEYYNTMIHGIYYRQQKEHDLHSQVFRFVPFKKDLDEIIPAQLFVVFLQENCSVKHPGYILKCMLQFITQNTRNLSDLICRIEADPTIVYNIENKIFKPIIENRVYYNDDVLKGFSNYFANISDLFQCFNDEMDNDLFSHPRAIKDEKLYNTVRDDIKF